MSLSRLGSFLGVVALAACGGGGGTTDPPNNNPPPGNTQVLGSITPSVTTLTMGAGTTSTISITAFDVNNAVITSPGTPSYTSTSATIAEVDGQGQVLAISAGSAQIRISLTKGTVTKEATVAVTVSGSLPGSADVVASSSDYIFTPRNVAVIRGGAVTWAFGILEHTVTFNAQAGAPTNITSGYLGAVSRTFSTAGNYNYSCSIHAGMSGQVVVR